MALITVKHKGDFKKTTKFFARMLNRDYASVLDKYGREGVKALSSATPVGTGETSASWFYEIERNGDSISLVWGNDNVNDGVNIAIVIDRGHANGRGYWIQGRHYIAPAILPVMDKIAEEIWEEVADK